MTEIASSLRYLKAVVHAVFSLGAPPLLRIAGVAWPLMAGL